MSYKMEFSESIINPSQIVARFFIYECIICVSNGSILVSVYNEILSKTKLSFLITLQTN